MEERKGTKVSFVTAILFFLVILAIVGFAICCVGMQKKCREEKIALQLEVEDIKKEVEVLEEKEVEKEDQTEENLLELRTNKVVNPIETLHSDVKEVIEEYSSYPNYLRIKSIKENSIDYPVGEDNYLVELDYYVINYLTETEYQKLMDDERILIDGVEYIFKNDNNDLLNWNFGYIEAKEKKENDIPGYGIIKSEKGQGYYFAYEIGGVSNYVDHIEKVIQVNMSKDTKISIATANDGDYTLETYPYKLTDEFLKNNKVTLIKINDEIYVHIDVR